MTSRIINRELEPFSVRLKEFYDVTHAERLLSDEFTKSLMHEPDGLIFQPSLQVFYYIQWEIFTFVFILGVCVLQHYVCGPCNEVLKWKPAELNSVDFKLKIVVEEGIG